MGRKHEYKGKEGETRVLFKKSNNTICTHSRTCSGASQFLTRSGVLQIKKNLSQSTDYYEQGNKVKRDLSIETDICILRRYCKSKRTRISNQGGSTKSRYSTLIDTEFNEIDEFNPNTSACGDSTHAVRNAKMRNIDVATVMIENFKGLLNNWIQRHLLDNKETKENIDTVLDSMLLRVDSNKLRAADSRSTYVLNREQKHCAVKNKKIETASIICQYCKHKTRPLMIDSNTTIYKDLSSHSVPFSLKKIRLVSTLSIPRNAHRVKRVNSLYAIQKIKHRKIALSIDRSSKILKSSTFDLLTISTKSLTKRCATYDLRKHFRKSHIALYPETAHKRNIIVVPHATKPESHIKKEKKGKSEVQNINRNHLDDLPSLVKSIYAGDQANVTSNGKHIELIPTNNILNTSDVKSHITNVQNNAGDNDGQLKFEDKSSLDKITMNEKDQSEPLITIDFLDKSFESPHAYINECIQNSGKNLKIKTRKRKNKRIKLNRRANLERIKNKNVYIHSNKFSDVALESKQFLKSIQHVLRYFSDYGINKNMKFDININISPLADGIDKCTDATSKIFSNEVKSNHLLTYEKIINMPEDIKEFNIKENPKTDEEIPEILVIPKLDGAESRMKYEFSIDSLSPIMASQETEEVMTGNKNDLEIVKEISELKTVIKDLTVVAEKFVTERCKEEQRKSLKAIQPSIHSSNISKNVEISCNFPAINQCGIKLSKEPKKNERNEYLTRLMKKSTSYNIIESESILKVTDMTIINEVENKKNKDEGIACSLPKSRSLFEVASEKKSKVVAYYCDRCNSKPDYIYDSCKIISNNVSSCPEPCDNMSNDSMLSGRDMKKSSCSQLTIENKLDCEKCSTSSSYVGTKMCERKPCCYTRRTRHKMGFGEGLVFCLLLWIPVIIIMCLLYIYVLQDFLNPGSVSASKELVDKPKLRIQKTSGDVEIKLSDLGF